LCDGAQMAIFGDLYFSEPRAARFRPASEIRTKATPCVEGSMADIHCATAEIRWEKKRKKKNKQQDENIMVCPIPQGDHN